MTDPQPDLAFTLAARLLTHVVERLTAVDSPPGKAFVWGGDRAIPADECCAGLVWTRVAQIVPSDGTPDIDRRILPAGDSPMGHAIRLEAGHLRCAPVIDEQGYAPAAARATADARAASIDRAAVRAAVECDFPQDLLELFCDAQVVEPWVPVVNAECAGGWITTSVIVTMVN